VYLRSDSHPLCRAGMTVTQLQLLGVGELLGGGAHGASPPLGLGMVLPPRVLNLPHISGAHYSLSSWSPVPQIS